MIAGGVAARSGVIIKGVDALERGHKTTDVLFDKTGTLTSSELEVVCEQVPTASEVPKEVGIAIVKALVKDNKHPVSEAIRKHLQIHPAPAADVQDIQSVSGSGIQGIWNGRRVQAGNPHWLSLEHDAAAADILSRGLTAFCLSLDNRLTLAHGLHSALRKEATKVVTTLHRRKLRCHLVSGDNDTAVHAVAAAVDIASTNVRARCTPAQKKDYVAHLQSEGRTVLFCGDGTNDAVAVAQANVGMQIGSASDVTQGVSDVTLLGGLGGMLSFLDVSRRSFHRIVFNFVWAAVYNVFAILLASGALVKVRVPPAYAGLGEIVSVGPVVLAAASLMWKKGSSHRERQVEQ